MEKVRHIKGSMVAIPMNDIDTDQIIPARFLKVTDKQGFGQSCILRLALIWKMAKHLIPISF